MSRGATDDRIARICDALSRPIPRPPRPQAKPRKTWQGLEPERQLRLRSDWFAAGHHLPEGALVTVAKCDSLGVELRYGEARLRWEDPDWRRMFDKVRKTPTRKCKKGTPS